VRPLSPKGYSELIFKDAAASIRRTAQEFQYQLIVQRAYEEGEEELLADEEDDDGGGGGGASGGLNGSSSSSSGLAGSDKDEKVFLLDESLRFRAATRAGSGEKVFAWRDLSGDLGDHFEFVCDRAVQPATQGTFELVAIQCQFERKYRRSHQKATEAELRQFAFSDSFLPSTYPAATTTSRRTSLGAPADTTTATSTTTPATVTTATAFASPAAAAQKGRRSTGQPEPADEDDDDDKYDNNDVGADADEDDELDDDDDDEEDDDEMAGKAAQGAKRDPRDTVVVAPPSAAHPKALSILVREKAELHLFDFNSGSFILQDPQVTAVVSETGPWQYWLQVTGSNKEWLGQPVVADINPVFNFEYLSFIFNHYTTEGAAYSWLLRFKDQEAEERFQQGLMQALWEQLNEVKWAKAKDDDREYILEAFQDLTMGEAGEGEEEDDEEEQEDEYEEEEAEETDDDEEEEGGAGGGRRSEHYDSDEEEDDVEAAQDADGNVNSQLAVGYKHDRSFVVRGPKIGVFKHTPDNNLEFSTSISRVETPKGKLFSPKKVMLHAEDSNMILQNADNPHSLYRMDLEYGKVVDEWKIDDNIPVTNFSPEKVKKKNTITRLFSFCLFLSFLLFFFLRFKHTN
jgi:tRNA (guanine9-N1)-methyltransferase